MSQCVACTQVLQLLSFHAKDEDGRLKCGAGRRACGFHQFPTDFLLDAPDCLKRSVLVAFIRSKEISRPASLGEAGRPRILSPGVGSTAIVCWTVWCCSSKAVSHRLDVIHTEGGPFDPCDKLIHPSTCVNFHPMVGIDSPCFSLHAGASPILDGQPKLEWSLREPIGGTYEAFRS